MPPRYPVALFAYARPDALARALAPLHAAGVSRIYAYVDGVAAQRDAAAHDAVVSMLRSVAWAEVTLTVRPSNLGLHAALRTGLDDFFAREPAGVIIEEDVRLADGAYAWICEALERYAGDPRAGAISAWVHRRVIPHDVRDMWWSGRWSCWGWAGWRRTWELMREPVDALLQRMPSEGMDPAAYGDDVVTCAKLGHWDAHLGLALCGARQHTLYPPRSIADHTGFGDSASNQHHAAQWRATPAAPVDPAWRWPARAEEHAASIALWRLASTADLPAMHAGRHSRRRRALSVAWHRLTRARGTWLRAAVLRAALSFGRPLGYDDTQSGVQTPMRYLWRAFLLRHHDAFFGRGLEIGDAHTLQAYGGPNMTSCEVVDRVARDGVDYACDLQEAWSLPANAFDVVVHQFTLHLLRDDRAALFHALRAAREEGTVLVTFPCAGAVPPDGETYGATHSFVWRHYTLPGVRALCDDMGLDASHVELTPLGGVAATAAYLLGVPVEAMDRRDIEALDERAPLLIAARLTKPVSWSPRWSPSR